SDDVVHDTTGMLRCMSSRVPCDTARRMRRDSRPHPYTTTAQPTAHSAASNSGRIDQSVVVEATAVDGALSNGFAMLAITDRTSPGAGGLIFHPSCVPRLTSSENGIRNFSDAAIHNA